ncbi:MAG TPA: glucoamylase family protein [Bacteroidales bacterium]|nr:glucoamylase family protein [Bacteroidales bacterium]
MISCIHIYFMKAACILLILLLLESCKDDKTTSRDILIDSVLINGISVENGTTVDEIDFSNVSIRFIFSSPVDTLKFNRNKVFFSQGVDTLYITRFSTGSDELTIVPGKLKSLTLYRLTLDVGPNAGAIFRKGFAFNFVTSLDTTPKFQVIPEDSLLSVVQKNTLAYFTDYAHPVSGMARERSGSNDVVTTGGTGFGLMAILVGIKRGFITKQQAFDQFKKVTTFLRSADTFHGAFPHWLNGRTGRVQPFSLKDNGGDLVETAFLMQGLLAVREYFRNGSEAEKALCDSITILWKNVDWNWYRNNGQDKLFWHWSPTYNWEMNMPVSGWNEALIVYILAAASPTHPITKEVYDNGWARNGAYPMKNGKSFYNIRLPLGEDYGGPLFFAHYSFLGLDPRHLADQYANYNEQNVAHSLINYSYCADNPKKRRGYSSSCWGLTASDIPGGYSASSPLNDLGVIAPTAALSSMPYTPEESLRALNFFYYVLGDRLWGNYGFKDAFSLTSLWFADSYIAIDQGPIICMIENYRSGFLWNLFMGSEEIKSGLTKLGFTF